MVNQVNQIFYKNDLVYYLHIKTDIDRAPTRVRARDTKT